MQTLIMVPTQMEFDGLVARLAAAEPVQRDVTFGGHSATVFPDLGFIVALGGLGKVQFAVQTQYMIDRMANRRTDHGDDSGRGQSCGRSRLPS